MTTQYYIDLFLQQQQHLQRNFCSVVKEQRERAFNVFKEQGLPNSALEDYQHTNVEKLFQEHLQSTDNCTDTKNASYDVIPSIDAVEVKVVDEKPQNIADNLPRGVFIGSIHDLPKELSHLVEKHYASVADMHNNGTIALNTMLTQDALVIIVSKGVRVDTPIRISNKVSEDANTLINRRLLIVAEKDAHLQIVMGDTTDSLNKQIICQVTEVYAYENAHVQLYEIENNAASTIQVTNTFASLETNANVLIHNISLKNGVTRNNFRVRLGGKNAEAYVGGLVIGSNQQRVDNHAFLDHAVPHCTSTQLFKYVLQDKAQGAFCGRILVQPDAQKTMAYQTNRNLCISPLAKMYSKPQLEIYADDVKCSHGLTTGQIDENALFYLRSRGIAKEQAQKLLMQAFANDVIQHIKLTPLRESLTDILQKRFEETC